jgi:hypothetical protein
MKLAADIQDRLLRAYRRKGSVFITAATGVVFDDIASAMRGHDVKDDVASSLTRWVSERLESGKSDLDVKEYFKDPATWKKEART